MDVKMLKKSLETLKSDMGESLLSCDLWDKNTGLSVISFRSNEKLTAQMSLMIHKLSDVLEELKLPHLGEYQIIDLENNTILLIINLDKNYHWSYLIDKTKISLGYIVFVITQKVRNNFFVAMEKN